MAVAESTATAKGKKMKKKVLLLVCLMIVSVLVMTACTQITDDTNLRREGYNIVVLFDCGRYSNETRTSDQDAAEILYGDISVEEKTNYVVATIENYQVRKYYYNKQDAYIPEPGTVNGIPETLLKDRVFEGWYLASVLEFKLDENGNPIKNNVGQYEYGAVVPQDTDQKWDFNTTLGTYENHPAVATKYVYDSSKPLDAQVTVNGQTVTNCVEMTDEQLGYNEKNGFNIHLYAKWSVEEQYVVKAQDSNGNWTEVYRTKPTATGKIPDISSQSAIKKAGKTFYGLYEDQALTQKWDSEKKFSQAFTGGQGSLRPYVILYAKYLEGDWSIVRAKNELTLALSQNKNIYLDADLTIDGAWTYIAQYSSEFTGNGHTITFTNNFVNPADRNVANCGLFGSISGNIHDVTFENVVVEIKNMATNPLRCGILAGVVEESATFSNVVVKGKIIYSEALISAVENGNWTVYHGGNQGANNDSWFGVNYSDTISGVTFENTANFDVAE